MSFYLTLPSNSSMQYFPNNALSNYSTKLSNTVELNGKYEVALVELMYPINWKICHSGNILIKNDKKDFVKSYSITINAMDNINDILNNINVEFKNDNVFVKFEYDNITKKVGIELHPGFDLEFLNGLHNEFGFRAEKFQSPPIEHGPHFYHSYESISNKLNSIKALYLYCDIVEHQYVGDSKNALLRTVVVENEHKYGDYINNIFTTPHYVPIKRISFETIELQITDDTGSKVHFSSGKIIAKLHFRKIINFF
jgi:hypothetical protein